MRLIIAGSRTIRLKPHEIVKHMIDVGLPYEDVTVVISGGARGVDKSGEEWAEWFARGLARYSADWEKYGKSAGFLRNRQMAKLADGLFLVWDGLSKGAADMKKVIEQEGKPVWEVKIVPDASADAHHKQKE